MLISTEQNSAGKIELLRAQRAAYSQAKLYGGWRVGIATAAIVLAPFILVQFPSRGWIVAVAGAVLTLISEQWLEGAEDQNKKYGATIQEQFDTELLNLPWNTVRVGERLAPELINSLARQDRGKGPLTDWYANTDRIPFPLDILVCQRANLTWDWRLREHFANAIIFAMLSWMLAVVAFGYWKHQELQGSLEVIVFPALPAISQAVKAYRGQRKNAAEKKELMSAIMSMWRRGLDDPATVTVADCRSVQDRIFDLRKEGPMVPDGWFNMLRNKYNDDMNTTAAKLREEAELKFSQKPHT